jgi:hypothetical protein
VIVECLGAVPKLDTDIVQRVLGFVFDSLNPEITGDQDYKVSLILQLLWHLKLIDFLKLFYFLLSLYFAILD